MTSSLTSILQSLRIVPATPSKTLPHKTFPRPSVTTTECVIASVLPSGLPEITLDEVSMHDAFNDCWVVIYDRVYDVTNFLRSHPGGEDVIMDHAGRDATLSFHGTGHSKDAIEQMRDFLIGELPLKERIFRITTSSVLSSGIPE